MQNVFPGEVFANTADFDTGIRAKLGASSTQCYSSQDQLATLDAHLQMLSKAGFKIVAVPWKYYGLAVFGGWL